MEWYDKLEEKFDELSAFFDSWKSMPAYLEGQDIVQDIAEDYTKNGVMDIKDVTAVCIKRGSQRLTDLIRKERGMSASGAREFIEVTDAIIDIDKDSDNYICTEEIVQGLNSLSDRDKWIVYGRYITGFSVVELSKMTDLSPNGIRKIIEKSLEKMKEFVV